jgi:hypothetical protein
VAGQSTAPPRRDPAAGHVAGHDGGVALPPLHRDPFDRLLVAQARRHDLVLATADRLVTQYDVRLLPVG